jgi:hypothetical protein
LSTNGHAMTPRRDAAEPALTAAVQPNPTLGVLMQMAAAGAFIGTLVAYDRRRKNPAFEPFPIVTRWSVAILGIGVMWLLLDAIR